VSALNRVYVLPAALMDIKDLREPGVQKAIVSGLVEVERNLEFGALLEARGSTGDLRGCRKVYVDKPTDQKPRFRVVYWCAPSERRPRQARILAVGVRAELGAYKLAVDRYNADRLAQGLLPVEDLDDRSLGVEPE
jgi:hypothetical protein